MNVVIIEDEIPARNKLKRFLSECNENFVVQKELDTVKGAIQFLSMYSPDLILSDIELLDGNAFEIYEQVQINCPIIFTTAYNQFLMDAFDTNGIAYLLKPFTKERFDKAISKFKLLKQSTTIALNPLNEISDFIKLNQQQAKLKKRFTIHTNQGILFLNVADISYFQAEEGVIFAYDMLGKKHLLSYSTLKEIEDLICPNDFFRINRSELVHKIHIEKIERYNKNSLSIRLKGNANYLKTSQSNTSLFKEWLDQ